MSRAEHVPTEVLSEQLTQILGGRRVRSAVFTTFSFDPGFFELEILPLLFEQPFDHRDKLKRIQLEDALRTVDHVAVYYDRSALSQDASPAQLDFRRLDVRRRTGVFHPKLVLLLVDNETDDGVLPSLIVSVSSANLTRAGWWENVESAHFEEIPHASAHRRTSFRPDLLSLIDQLRRSSHPDDDHGALDAAHRFLLTETRSDRLHNVRYQGRWFTQLFWGQDTLPNWLADLNLGRREWNLEIVSPFFDIDPEPTVCALIDALQPREVRIHLPEEPDGRIAIPRDAYDTVYQYAWWSRLPGPILQRTGHQEGGAALPRPVHAKVYRLWNQQGDDLALVGSVNLTRPAHSRAREGNLEAAFLVDLSGLGLPRRWWLRRLDEEPGDFVEELRDDGSIEPVTPIDLTLRYDWTASELACRYEGTASEPITICQSDGVDLHTVDAPTGGQWQILPRSVADRVSELLQGTSFLLLRRGATEWRVLVREEGLSHRPSLLSQLTAEEILRYWSLLTPEQKAAFLEKRLSTEGLEGLAPSPRHQLEPTDSIFDRFAGLYHAFGQLQKHIDHAFEEDRPTEVASRLLGAKYDSVPTLLARVWQDEDADPVQRYLTFLCARQVWEGVHREHRDFARAHAVAARPLLDWLERLPALRGTLGLGPDDDEFVEWFEGAFLRPAHVPEEVA